MGEDGSPLKHCLVSGATRYELEGYSGGRVSQSKAMTLFGLSCPRLRKAFFEGAGASV